MSEPEHELQLDHLGDETSGSRNDEFYRPLTYDLLFKYMDSKFSDLNVQITLLKAEVDKLNASPLERRVSSLEHGFGITRWVGGVVGTICLAVITGLAANSTLIHHP